MFNWTLLAAVLLPNACRYVHMLMNIKSYENMAWYHSLKKPSWYPPRGIFAPVWAILYFSMGYASYIVLIHSEESPEKTIVPLTLYAVQLLLNFSWSSVFFGLRKVGLALGHMLVLDLAAVMCTIHFAHVDLDTLYYMVPYLAWLGFITCINYQVLVLNDKNEKKDKE